MFEFAKFRTRLIISIYSLTGIKKSELIDLKLKHLQNIASHNLYKFTIYENTKEEYFTLCTPECSSMIDEYISQRKNAWEKITDESYFPRSKK
jgi:site-specific recombinase XerD